MALALRHRSGTKPAISPRNACILLSGFQANQELEEKVTLGKLILKNKSQNLEIVELKESGFTHLIDLEITPAPPLRFKFLETLGTHLWDYVKSYHKVMYRQCLAHSLPQNA